MSDGPDAAPVVCDGATAAPDSVAAPSDDERRRATMVRLLAQRAALVKTRAERAEAAFASYRAYLDRRIDAAARQRVFDVIFDVLLLVTPKKTDADADIPRHWSSTLSSLAHAFDIFAQAEVMRYVTQVDDNKRIAYKGVTLDTTHFYTYVAFDLIIESLPHPEGTRVTVEYGVTRHGAEEIVLRMNIL